MLDRGKVVDSNFTHRVSMKDFPKPISRVSPKQAGLDKEACISIFTSQVISRQLDLYARVLKDDGLSFYTIGSSGHEGNAAIAHCFRHTDPAFLHYRSGAFVVHRTRQLGESDPIYEQMLSFVASKDDPISAGRHKVFGSVALSIPPQTSTIASHLPKACGAAMTINRAKEMNVDTGKPTDSVVLCNFGDASLNHATSQASFNMAQYVAAGSYPLPLVYICEDNGIGISVPTPKNWVRNTMQDRPGIHYVHGNGLHFPDAYLAAQEAEFIARKKRKPVFLHINTVRLMGHAGSDIESIYRNMKDIEAWEAQDPLLHSARILVEEGYMTSDEIIALYESTREQVIEAAKRAIATPKLSTAEEVMESIAPLRPAKQQPEPMKRSEFAALLGNQTKFLEQPRNLCQNINYALHEVLHKYPNSIICGEDVGKKGGVYRVTADLQARFGQRRVFDTMLDETSILGASIGAAQMGCIPIPEIQFLAYTHNAEDQIRGEAATLSFFSNGQYTNPMVIRIAGLAYQKGFGGHFHNDNAFAFLREIPGVIVACPSVGDDAALMFKECMRLADEQKRVVVFLEPIALYMTKDLHEKGDNGWLKTYPLGQEALPFGEPSVFNEPCKNAKEKVAIVTYGNGNFLSRQAEKILREQHQIETTIIDLRWLVPLHMDKVIPHLAGFDKVLVVDECRKTGSLSEEFITRLIEEADHMPQVKRITGHDTFIPIGKSWEFVLPATEDIVNTVAEWCKGSAKKVSKKKATAKP